MERTQGILLPLFSLPSPYGIGTLGKEAYEFIDFLKESGQSVWQLLPMGPTSYGDSPYQSFSTFAGNPYFIDLRMLIDESLLTKEEADAADLGTEAGRIDYGKLYFNRFPLLRTAYERGKEAYKEKIKTFRKENAWAEGYALFMSLKETFEGLPLVSWPDEELKKHKEDAVKTYAESHEDDINFWLFLQVLFFEEWDQLRAYAHENSIRILGDLPIYVAMDSADVWTEPENFLLDEDLLPKAVAGVPPDAFSDEGQLWGNPLYDYDFMKKDGFGWWIRRVDGAARLYDIIRIDHFRGFDSYWEVPAGAETAKEGAWRKGPGMDLVGVLTSWFPKLKFVAEDLGIITPDVRKLLKDSGLPGMKVLEFAFEHGTESQYLPHNMTENSICYLGTHDNETLLDYVQKLSRKDKKYVKDYLGIKRTEALPAAILRAGMMSTSLLFVLQAQDLLMLGAEGRINTPGTLAGNWVFRLTEETFWNLQELAPSLYENTKRYGRLPKVTEETEA